METITDLVLVERDEQFQTPPVERFSGPQAIREAIEGELRVHRAARDEAAERESCLELAARMREEHLHPGESARLLRRALELEDDSELRDALVEQLCSLGRQAEAANVLQASRASGPRAAERAGVLLRASRLLALAGERPAAEQALEQAFVLTPEEPAIQERLGALRGAVADREDAARTAERWLQAASLHPSGSTQQLIDLARAYDAAPHHLAAATTYAAELERLGRIDAADEVLRTLARSRETPAEVRQLLTGRRIESACIHGSKASALGAALDSSLWDPTTAATRGSTLQRLLRRPELSSYAVGDSADRRGVRRALSEAAFAGHPAERAQALEELAAAQHADGRALLLALAAESHAAAGHITEAQATALQACRLAPWSARAAAALFDSGAAAQADAATLERALGLVTVRAARLAALADRLESAGHPWLALRWTRRWLDQEPGNPAAALALLERAASCGEPNEPEASIRRVLSLGLSIDELAPGLAEALAAVGNRDSAEARRLGQLILHLAGADSAELYSSLAEVVAGDAALASRLLVRRASGPSVSPQEQGQLMLEAASLALEAGAPAEAASHLRHAARLAADVEGLVSVGEAIRSTFAAAPDGAPSDAVVDLAHADAWAAEQQSTRSAVAAWRRLAAARWDLAADRIGAEEAFFIACSQDPEQGPYRYAADLVDRAGAADAVSMMARRIERLSDDGHDGLKSRLLAAAGWVAAQHGMFDRAIDFCIAAIRLDPFRNDAVAIVERVADGDEGIAALNLIYDTIARFAFGKFGVRAAHYRAARQLEQRGAYADALRHAVSAFEAVPSEGACHALLLRLANRCSDEDAAVRSMASVASSGTPENRLAWLRKAAELAASSAHGRELRFDLFLTAFGVDPSAETVEWLADALAARLGHGSDDEVVAARFEEAVTTALPRLKGPRGAFTAIALAEVAARVVRSGALAAQLLQQALSTDPHGGGYEPVLDHLDVIAAGGAPTATLLEAIRERHRSTYGPDPSLTRFGHELAKRMGEDASGLAAPELESASPPSEDRGEDTLIALRLDEEDLGPEVSVATEGVDSAPTPSEPPPSEDRGETAREALAFDSDAEDAARADGDYARVAAILAARARATEDPEERRYVRLRRAAVLEQRLGRLSEAAEELATILDEAGEDPTALRYLADLYDRRQRFAEAAGLWLRAARQARTDAQRLPDLVRCCESSLSATDPATAQRVLDAMDGLPVSDELAALREDLAVRLQEGEGLDEPQDDAFPANREAPTVGTFRIGPPPDPSDPPGPRKTLPPKAPELAPAEPATTADADLRAGSDTTAPSVDATLETARLDYRLRGAGTAHEASRTMAELDRIRDAVPDDLADLWLFLLTESVDAALGEDEAVALLEAHIDTDDPSPLAGIALAERLVRRGERERGLTLYEQTILASGGDLHGLRSRGQVTLDAAGTAYELGREERARLLLELALQEDDSTAAARQRLAEWFPASPAPRARLSVPPSAVGPATRPSSQPTAPAETPEAGQPAGELRGTSGSDLTATLVSDGSRAGAAPVPSGDTLVDLLEQAAVERGQPDLLERLERAARDDLNDPLARAIHHVRHAFDEQDPPELAPPLSALTPQPELTARLLFSSLAVGVNEALAIVTGAKLLRRDMSHYGLSGADRVPLAAGSVLGRVFAMLTGLLEVQGARLFQPNRNGPLRYRTALITPLSTIVEGRAEEETPLLRYVLGSALAAAMPPFALVEALSREEVERTLGAVLAGFGPVGAISDPTAEQMRLAEDLWHLVSASEERRLRELCAEPEAMSYELAHRRARWACRRAGLFASGDIRTAIRQTVAELELSIRTPLDEPEALAELCSHDAIADLVDLALRPEYAEIRWHHQPQSVLGRRLESRRR